MPVRIGINGLGRIGKGIVVAWVERNFEGLEIVMINDKTEAASFAHLLKYDSVHGRLHADLRAEGNCLFIGSSRRIALSSCQAPEEIPWEGEQVDIVLECTGKFAERSRAGKHLHGPVKKVIISAPSKNPDATVVLGVNEETYDPGKHHVISNASCTTNCLAPVVKVLQDRFGIERGFMTTVHSYTNDQKILDKYHKDLRRARAGALSIIPTSTGAAKAIGQVIPELAGKLDGLAVRVPTPNVSLIDLVVSLKRKTSKEEINRAFQEAEQGFLRGILATSHEPLVSVDFNGTWESAIVDLPLTTVIDGHCVKILAWYDNETGFCHRMMDLAILVGKRL